MKEWGKRKKNCIIEVLICMIAVLLVVIFADETNRAVAEVDETVESRVEECAAFMKMDAIEAQYWNQRLIQDGVAKSDWDEICAYGYEDLDRNGQKDLWLLVNSTVKDVEKSTVYIYRNNEAVHIQPMPAYCYSMDITAGDFDDDGDMEFALLGFTGGNGGVGSSAKVFLEEFENCLVEKELPGDLIDTESGDIGFHIDVTFSEEEGVYELSCAVFEESQIIQAEYTRDDARNYFQNNHTSGKNSGQEGRGYYEFFVIEEDGREYLAARQYVYKEAGISDGLCDVIFVFDWTWAGYGYVKDYKIVACGTTQELTQVRESKDSTSEEEERSLAFGEALWHVFQRGILPDGGKLEHTYLEASRGNSFAIVDIDGDGKEELVLRWTNASMAGLVEYVFDYKDGFFYKELGSTPYIKYYNNGNVEVQHLRGETCAETLFPYDVFSYDEKKDAYQYVATALSWDKALLDKNADGVPFPDELDVDGDGVLYYILSDFSVWPFDVNCLVDGAEYEEWRNSHFEGTEEINMPYQALTEENIAVLGYPEPYIKIPEPKG